MSDKASNVPSGKPGADDAPAPPVPEAGRPAEGDAGKVPESGGRGGLDPTRYGDWEKNGRCIDF
jgi:hypothetical protein